jgi:tetratricopeptide (TPR) repeat protein
VQGAPPTPEGPFAFRDPRDGAPPPPLSSRDEKALDTAFQAFRRGDTAGTARVLQGRRRKGAPEPAPFVLVAVYLDLAAGNVEDAKASLGALTAAHPAWSAAVEAAADLSAMEGQAADALERYRTLARLAPKDKRASGRVETLRAQVAAEKRLEAESALASGDLDVARRAAHSLLQLEPSSPSGLVLLARAAAAGGRNDDAWTWAKEARKRAPSDPAVAAFAADAAAKAGRWAEAASLYEGLASADPAFLPKAEEARVEFKVQNLPEAAHLAAESARLTRAQLASLLWWTVPEFRDALVPPGAEIAVDVVDRTDRGPLATAIGLGFFTVSSETHRVGADWSVSRGEMATALRKVAFLAGRGRPPKGCLAPEPPVLAQLSECGILSDTPSRYVTGREALRALEKAARLGREGGTR